MNAASGAGRRSWLAQAADAVLARYRKLVDHRFDRRYSIDTGADGVDYISGIATESARCAIPYEPVQCHTFYRMMRHLSIDPRGYIFVDLGSGKGRATFLAAAYQFEQIVGVELSMKLHEIAARNLVAFRKNGGTVAPTDLVCGDAREYQLPPRHIVLFLYNPFVGAVMDDVVAGLERFLRTRDNDLWLLYRNPLAADRLDQVDDLTLDVATSSYRIYKRRRR